MSKEEKEYRQIFSNGGKGKPRTSLDREYSSIMRTIMEEVPACVVQSLNDGYADYVFNAECMHLVTYHFKTIGHGCVLAANIKDDTLGHYWQVIPVSIYRKPIESKDEVMLSKYLLDDTILQERSTLKCVYEGVGSGFERTGKGIVIKDYNGKIDREALKQVIKITNDRNR